MEFPTPGLECTYVHVVQYESCCIRQTEVSHILVFALSPEVGEVHVHPVVEQTCLESELGLVVHLRFQGLVRAGVAVLETAADVLGCLKCRVDCVRSCILTYLCVGSSQLQV